jgi:hypothetical protein
MPRISPAIWKPVTWSRPSSSQDVGLEKAGLDGKDGLEGIAGAIQVLATLQLAAATDQAVEANHVLSSESKRQAQFAQVALRAGDLEVTRSDGDYGLLDVCMHAACFTRRGVPL